MVLMHPRTTQGGRPYQTGYNLRGRPNLMWHWTLNAMESWRLSMLLTTRVESLRAPYTSQEHAKLGTSSSYQPYFLFFSRLT